MDDEDDEEEMEDAAPAPAPAAAKAAAKTPEKPKKAAAKEKEKGKGKVRSRQRGRCRCERLPAAREPLSLGEALLGTRNRYDMAFHPCGLCAGRFLPSDESSAFLFLRLCSGRCRVKAQRGARAAAKGG